METNLSWKHQSGPAILKLYSSHGSARELGIISTKRGCHGVRHTCLHRSQKILWHYGFSCIFLEHLSPDHLVSFHCTVVYYNRTTVWQNYKPILHSNFIQWLVFSTDALHCHWKIRIILRKKEVACKLFVFLTSKKFSEIWYIWHLHVPFRSLYLTVKSRNKLLLIEDRNFVLLLYNCTTIRLKETKWSWL